MLQCCSHRHVLSRPCLDPAAWQYFHLAICLQLLVLAGCVVAVSAAPRPDGPPVYGPKPVAPYKEPEVFPPQPYEYKYGVADDYSKSSFDKVETQDEYGKVQGSYKVRYLGPAQISHIRIRDVCLKVFKPVVSN